MKKKVETRLAIDIGAASIKIAEFSFPNPKEMVLEKFVYEEYAGETDSNEARLPMLESTLKKMLAANKFRSKKAYLSISGQTTFIRFIKLPPASEQEQQVNQLVAFEARQNIPYPLEEVTWDYQLISPIDNAGGEINVMFAVIKNDIISSLIKILERSKLTTELVDITPTTFYNAAKANRIGEDEPAMILNMGSFCSTLVFINQNHFYARTIPVAGYTITQQIMKELQISFEEAESMKRNIGFVALGGAYEDADSEAATIISKIIRNVMTRLHSEINRSINVYRSQQKAPAPKKLYLAGGSSIINFTERFLSTKLKMETEYFNPFNVVKISSSINRNQLASYAHMTAEVIGLGLRHITTCPIEISLLPSSVSKKYFIQKKIPYIIAICVMILICILTLFWGEYRQYNGKNKLIESQTRIINSKNKNLGRLKKSQDNLKKTQKQYNENIAVLKNRGYWPDLLNNFQNCLPDNAWLVSFTPYSKALQTKPAVKTSRRTLFGKKIKKASKKAVEKNTKIDWIKVKGHSLIIHSNQKKTPAEILKQNIVKSKYFSDKPEDIKILSYMPIASIQNNITTFELDIKLKTPLEL
jgi:type IV pilus assembly protein PilM